MDVLGTFSNNDLHAGLSKVAKKLRVLRRDEKAKPRPRAERRKRPGWVLKAVVEVLSDAAAPMRPDEIQRTLEARLGHPVAGSSIRNTLTRNRRHFARVGRGRYVLCPASPPQAVEAGGSQFAGQ
ncbi:MAG TPA: hypothetical protein VF250_02880 [Conexibacter sp.]